MTATFDLSEFLVDPVGSIERAQKEAWLVDGGLAPVVVRYDEVRRVLTDPGFQASFDTFLAVSGVNDGPFREWMRLSPLNRDGEEHKEWRAMFTKTFTPRSVERLRPGLAVAANELIDEFAPAGACEFMEAFADIYPSVGLCDLIGVPVEDRDRFTHWANIVGLGFNLSELLMRQDEVDQATVELNDYARGLVEERRRDPQDDLVSRMAVAADELGGIWDDQTIAGSIAGLVFAGHETTKNQLGWMVFGLSDRPDLWDGIGDRSMEPGPVVDELMRWRSAVTSIGRSATQPFEHDGERIEAGTTILVSLWGADHDPRAFPHASELDVEANRVSPHAAFGHGPHHCIGANLARAELQEALLALTSRLTCPVVDAGSTWRPPLGITGPETLPITFATR